MGITMTYRKLLQALDREKVDYQILRGTAASLKGNVHCTDGVDIFVNPSQRNLKRIGRTSQSLRAALRISVRPANIRSKKRRIWYMPSKEELLAYSRIPVREKLRWLEEVNQEICRTKPKKN